MKIKGIFTGLVWVLKTELSEALLYRLRESYTYHHPMDDTMFSTYYEMDDRIGLPYGNKDKLHTLLPSLEVEDRTISTPTDSKISLTGLELRDYQDEVLQDVLKYFSSGGTTFNLGGKPGSGKSVLIAGVLAELGIKTLIIAHLSMLTTQIGKELRQFTDGSIKELSAKDDTLSDINIATSQFISGRPELWSRIKHTIGCIIIDESETAASLTTLRILQRSHAKYRIFISATFSRSVDRRTEALRDMAGNKVFTLNRTDLLTPNIMMVQCEEVHPPYVSQHTYIRQKQKFFKLPSIMDKIMYISEKSLAKGRYILIATDIKAMQKEIHERLGFGVLNGDTSKKERERILKEFNDGTLKGITGAAVLTAGLSIPRVSTIVRVSFPGSAEKNVQLVGRSVRDFEGKEGAWVFDLMFHNKSHSDRVAAYKKAKYKVTFHTWDVLKGKL